MKNILKPLVVLQVLSLLFIACNKDDTPITEDPGIIPTITGFTPESGIPGTLVTISGTDFGELTTTNVVRFGETIAPITSATPTELVAILPVDAVTSKIHVSANKNTATSDSEFIVEQPQLILNKIELELFTLDSETLLVQELLNIDADGPVVWKSSNTDIAQVDDQGLVTGINAGVTTVVAQIENISAKVIVTVNPSVFISGKETLSNGGLQYSLLWKNGVRTTLTNGSQFSTAGDVVVDGQDVYVAISEVADFEIPGDAILWKNGMSEVLPNGGNSAQARNIFIDGNDVHVAGTIRDSNGPRSVTVWTNGVRQDFAESDSYFDVRSFVVDNSTFYTCGFGSFNNESNTALFWENETFVSLAPDNVSVAESIAISNSKIYVAGAESIDNQPLRPVLWIDQVPNYYPNPGLLSAVFIDGQDVYTAGYEIVDDVWKGKVWKNGEVLFELSPESPNDVSPRDIFVYDSKVYTVGTEEATENGRTAMLWVNDTPIVLSDGMDDTFVTAVFVR